MSNNKNKYQNKVADLMPGGYGGEIRIIPKIPGSSEEYTIRCNLSVSEGEAARGR